ncbi:hypothetical protein [Anatilimnocola floriformis]|uniref:hypothetical protein n=1 Tax=Anatilimnocola floriformis TaxID=2948575 RepID=UPI0020C433A5|nr:hypothetical protein [Anatilimnocola floriformis]
MAKKSSKSDRSDPKQNKSLATRLVMNALPGAKASEIVATVKKEHGHVINPNMVYMIKTKTNMAGDGRAQKSKKLAQDNTLTSAALWVDAIKLGRQLLKSTGSLANAIALLKAIEG